MVNLDHYQEDLHDNLMENNMYIHDFTEIGWVDPFYYTEKEKKHKSNRKMNRKKSIIVNPEQADLSKELVYDESKYN
jgi:hypothetical protein